MNGRAGRRGGGKGRELGEERREGLKYHRKKIAERCPKSLKPTVLQSTENASVKFINAQITFF